MDTEKKREIFVIGHKNPDTDSICSAIAYANLKNKITGDHYVARRAGQINEETHYVLDYFGVKIPKYVADVGTQVKDMELHEALKRFEKVESLVISIAEGDKIELKERK